uniref:Putative aminoglycoside phosphotransferase n=1 Tax=Magnetococcus massalia (strain MO-1) TaxID=451514 RepID=A0A1S7LD35_MAGMO|nr:Putative aminoglycoside phosphotransferase [Candidatus Magnetococcus massalia]
MLNPAAHTFLQHHLPQHSQIEKVAGDASFRSYYRVHDPAGPRILMDAPPDKEDSAPFVEIARFLRQHGVHTPRVDVTDYEKGLFLLEDMGDVTYARALADGADAQQLYGVAIDRLVTMQATPLEGGTIAHGRAFDRKLLRTELALLTDWYIDGIMATPLSTMEREAFDGAFQTLLDALLEQPRFFVHRDYHSRNLMWLGGEVGVLDFQDAVMGPVTYDLASLLRDCYIAWDAPFRQEMMARWLAGAGEQLNYRPSAEAFEEAFDWMAVQRNLKAVGIFGRLALRDGKYGYLDDVARTMGYVRETLARYSALEPLQRLLAEFIPAGQEPAAATIEARQATQERAS